MNREQYRAFRAELEAVCVKYRVYLDHEDGHGAAVLTIVAHPDQAGFGQHICEDDDHYWKGTFSKGVPRTEAGIKGVT